MRKTVVGFMGTLLVGVIASLAVAGAQVPNGGWTTTSSTGATGTAGMGNPSNPNGQQGHFTDSTGNSWLMKWDSVAQQYTLFFKGQEVGTMNFSTTPPVVSRVL